MEERWKFHDMMRDVKRKKMRGEFTPPTNISTELFVKILLKYQEREEKWRKEYMPKKGQRNISAEGQELLEDN